jgi:hypothetical protein
VRALAAPCLALALAVGCAAARGAAPVPTGRGEDAARETLRRFAEDLQDRRFGEAYALLSGRWRAAYTPTLLAADWEGAGPLGRDQAERVLALLAAGAALVRRGDALELEVGQARAARLVPEDAGWRVEALE